MEQETGIELYIEAAEQHGKDSEPDHEVGDLQDVARKMWEIMSPGQRMKLMADADVREVVEMNLSDVDFDESFAQLAEEQLKMLRKEGAPRFDVYSELVTAFPGFLNDEEVNGGDLVEWVNENIDLLYLSAT